ncbi:MULTISPECIES: diacylglycerol kinase family lipid kinase [unclassified Lactococcus]|uniref:diacylglycerol kinase family lipid kinase n=1 Tax=unclassified Lactococcus TaxID=2643510 RepID=UPI0011C74FB5|nr:MULTISPECIES: diacylglycerol kinase family lipid kinase [unclassified Lactococcus]MQW22053.1 YegS/Rv2252/BmrU family lipid kinase [Lactococcus sp. dk101]TXK44996.1 diacylglycerol kinase family lipid kinase [Lactococcus sp. dk310]TXK51223.1 diacylglycerol kinase family lipid kinase [Lactococcus sp. dk322]
MKERKLRARLIYNPSSGQEIMKKNVADVLEKLESFGYEASAFQTKISPKSAEIEADRATKDGFDLIVAAGGDGTINEVVSGISGNEKRPKLAIIPAGTTNDFARALKIPRNNPIDAVDIIGKNQTLKVDVGVATPIGKDSKYFINIAAGGALTELTYSVPSNLKTMFGYLAYLSKGAELLPRVKCEKVRVTHDQGVFEGKMSMFFVALTNSVGGFEKIAPDAKLDDGKFTLILVKTDKLFELIALLGMVANGSGKHVNDVNVEYIKTSHLKVEPLEQKRPTLINLDGEFGGEAPVEFDNLKNHIEMFVNLDEINDLNYIGDDEETLAFEAVAQKFAEEADRMKSE